MTYHIVSFPVTLMT